MRRRTALEVHGVQIDVAFPKVSGVPKFRSAWHGGVVKPRETLELHKGWTTVWRQLQDAKGNDFIRVIAYAAVDGAVTFKKAELFLSISAELDATAAAGGSSWCLLDTSLLAGLADDGNFVEIKIVADEAARVPRSMPGRPAASRSSPLDRGRYRRHLPDGAVGVAAGLSIAIAALAACAFAALGYLCVLHRRYKETAEVSV